MSFDAHTSDNRGTTTFHDSPKSAGAVYFFDVAIRLVRER